MKVRVLALACVGFLTAAACGGDNATTGDGGPDGSLGDGGNQPDGTANPDGSTNPDGGTNPDGSTNPDGGTGDGGGSTSVKCGTSTCALPGPCCITGANTATCVSDGGACQPGGNDVSLKCASAADCPSSQVCCLDATLTTPAAVCAATCTGQDHAMLCDPSGTAQANACGDAGACGNGNIDTWGLTSAYGTCGDVTGPL